MVSLWLVLISVGVIWFGVFVVEGRLMRVVSLMRIDTCVKLLFSQVCLMVGIAA